MSTLVLGAGLAFFAGAVLIAVGVAGPPRRAKAPLTPGQTLRDLLPTVKEGDEQNLRLAGITPEAYAVQRFAGLIGGVVVGTLISVVWGRGLIGTAVVVGLFGTGGWLLPMLGMRDTAKKARNELDQVVRVWIALVAQQVSAGTDPNVAMLTAARAGRRNSWRLLHRFLLAAQQDRRPAWGGMADLVDRYGIHSLAPVVSALGLAAERGTRVSEAVLVAADTLWRDTTSREREKAGRRAQIIMVPATGVALALAGILVYPPFTSLTGGGIAWPSVTCAPSAAPAPRPSRRLGGHLPEAATPTAASSRWSGC